MFKRLHSRMRATVSMFCMALMAVVVAQGAIMMVDKAQHSFGVDHAATPIAGEVHFGHDHDHDHQDGGDIAGSDQSDDGDGSRRHHHVSESPQLATLDPDLAVEIVRMGVITVSAPTIEGVPQRLAGRLERPPKSISKTLA
jgi:hypothetical protein